MNVTLLKVKVLDLSSSDGMKSLKALKQIFLKLTIVFQMRKTLNTLAYSLKRRRKGEKVLGTSK